MITNYKLQTTNYKLQTTFGLIELLAAANKTKYNLEALKKQNELFRKHKTLREYKLSEDYLDISSQINYMYARKITKLKTENWKVNIHTRTKLFSQRKLKFLPSKK